MNAKQSGILYIARERNRRSVEEMKMGGGRNEEYTLRGKRKDKEV
jgi:hypothetical protein